jgi:hypothetical protein
MEVLEEIYCYKSSGMKTAFEKSRWKYTRYYKSILKEVNLNKNTNSIHGQKVSSTLQPRTKIQNKRKQINNEIL